MTKVFNKTAEKAKRKTLRNNMPIAEKMLWSKLKGKGLGYKFRRQYGVEAFVLDFCCPELRLAIEVDGDSHYTEEASIRDEERQRIIEEYGFSFLRFTNDDVTENVDGVLADICRYIEDMTAMTPLIPPQSSPTPPISSPWQGEVGRGERGGEVAGKARKDLEKKTGNKVVSSENYLTIPESRKILERKK